MKLGVLTNLMGDKPLDEVLAYLKPKGIEAVEIGCGGYPGKAHADPKVLLNDEAKLNEFKATIEKYGMIISGLSAHGNPLHPNKEIAKQFDDDLTDAILLAEKLGVEVINCFSGCPGDCETSKHPNWVVCPWPEDFTEVVNWQWNEKLIPYWKEKVAFAKQHGVHKFALEMHPGFCVYNPETALRLRAAVGEEIGVNFDPSHLIWQGIDPAYAIRILGKEGAIFHFHAKDTKVDKYNTMANGVLDTKHYGDEINRSWIFRSCGYGNDYAYWKDMISNLVMTGYDHVLSIEHEDSLMSVNEGLTKAIDFLQEVLTHEKLGAMWWA
ncbi:sugar phosphate isomerase/epimerase [Phocea massiliensis]|uniref:Sugar phosphate isomerase/epimerase n=1 Tax=Merdimmobilis hominis TaxID=2897707 RepID=A0A938X4M5_9FIRM|nr:sugar phosphate isomerase/epimerase [Merdimmobilis hominis]MBM6919913.1 sugar phosphate isomerase/epimerase [Merdimmobilis hominis]